MAWSRTSSTLTIVVVLNTRNDETEWRVTVRDDARRSRTMWMNSQRAQKIIRTQVRRGGEEPLYLVRKVGIRFRPAWEDLSEEDKARLKQSPPGAGSPLDEQFVKRTVWWEGFEEPTVHSLSELRQMGICVM